MRRRLFNFAFSLSLLCLAIIVAFWIRGLTTSYEVRWQSTTQNRRDVRSYSLRTGRGGFQLEDFRVFIIDPKWLQRGPSDDWPHALRSESPQMLPFWTLPWRDDDFLGYPYDWPEIGEPSLLSHPRITFHTDHRVNASFDQTWRGVVLPYWIPALAAFLLLALRTTLFTRRALRKKQRSRRGLCPVCGYDLRGNPDRCSECGTPRRAPRADAAAVFPRAGYRREIRVQSKHSEFR